MATDPHTYEGEHNTLTISPTSDPGVVDVDLMSRAERRGFWMEVPVGKLRSMIAASTTTPADDMDGGVTAAAIEKEAEQTADCEARQWGFICTREKDHSGPHIAATVALHHSVAEVWDQAERHEKGNARIDPRYLTDPEHAKHLGSPVRECPDPEVHEGGPFDLAAIFRDKRDAAERMAALWKEATREHVGRSRTALSWAQMCEESLRTTLTRAEKAEKERDEARDGLTRLARALDLPDTATTGDMIARIEEINCHDCIRDAAVIREPHPLTARENLAALWESAHRPVGGRIPAGTAIITRSDYGSGDVRYQTLEATGRDLPDPGYTLERNYNYGPENGEEYRLLDPPARPEGAEKIEALIDRAGTEGEGADNESLADYLTRCGVRVVGSES